MVISGIINKKRKETAKKATKAKGNFKNEKTTQIKTKKVANMKLKHAKDAEKEEREINAKSTEKDSVVKTENKTKKVLSRRKTEEKRIKPEQKADDVKVGKKKESKISEEHVADAEERLQCEQVTGEESQKSSRRALKRKISPTEYGTEKPPRNIKSVASKKRGTELKETVGLPTSKVQKEQKLDSQDVEENCDSSNTKDLSRQHILQCITAIFHLTQEQLKSKNALFDGESHPVFMQVTCIRVPKTPRRQMRIILPHSIVSPGDEVALFVCDLQRGRRKDCEPTVEHYQEILAKHGCTSINSVIPLNQVKTEYDQYELKRKLVSSFDHFLVDGRIAGHMSHLLGKIFYKKRKLPVSIRMHSKDLKHEIEYALKKTCMQLHSQGDTHIAQIGNTSMKEEELADNILSACCFLSKNYPGGWDNIRCIRIKTPTSLSVPIYMTLKNKNTVPVPEVPPRRPKAYRNVSGVLSTMTSKATVTVTPDGDVIVQRKKREKRMKQEEVEEHESAEESNS